MRSIIGLAAVLLAATVQGASAQTKSSDYKEPYQQKALEIYRTAIGIPTVAGRAKTPALATYLADEFRDGGFPDEDIHILPFDIDGEDVNGLVVRYRGNGAAGKKPILLIAHMDVVEAFREDWDREPFKLIEEDGYFYGRGVIDDKFGVSILTATFLRLKAEGFTPNRDLIISFSGDEETGMLTTRALVTKHRKLTDAEFALNADTGGGMLNDKGEGLAYIIQAAEKTYATFELTTRHAGGHSSAPRLDNAIFELNDAIARLRAYRFPVRSTELSRAQFAAISNMTPGPVGDAMRRLSEDPSDKEAADVLWDQPDFVGMTRTTCTPTMLRGGHAENALPNSATVTVNCRIFPGVEVETVQQTLRDIVDNDRVEIKMLDDPKATPYFPLREDVAAAVEKAVHARYPGIPIVPILAPYATEARELNSVGIPTVGVMGLFAPFDHDGGVHGRNENVPVAAFFGALEHWRVLLDELAGQSPDTSAE
ncbi:MAG: M20/M25/M40 family metallo-hydrolase [Pseudomonadota bacterium]